jgi:hypothetical protein
VLQLVEVHEEQSELPADLTPDAAKVDINRLILFDLHSGQIKDDSLSPARSSTSNSWRHFRH